MKIYTQLDKEGIANLESGEIAFLDDALKFLLTALHVEGYSYVHNLIAVKDGGDMMSATGETYQIKQHWDKNKTLQILIDVKALTELQQDVDYYKSQTEQLIAIRNKIVKENNDLRDQLSIKQQYQVLNEDLLK